MKLPKIKYSIYVLVVFTCNIYQLTFSQEFDLRFNKLTIEDGLVHPDIKDITQDNSGFLWMGSLSGLSKFDGYEFKNFINKSNSFRSIYDNRINKLHLKNNYLWLATEGGLNCFNLQAETFFNLRYELLNDTLNEKSYLNSVFVSDKNIVYTIRKNNIRAYKVDYLENRKILLKELKIKGKPEFTVFTQIDSDTNNNLWLTTNNGLFEIIEQEGEINISKVLVKAQNGIHKNFNGIYAKDLNYIFLGTKDGFLKVNISGYLKEKKLSATFYEILLPDNKEYSTLNKNFEVYFFQKGTKNSYWIGSSYGIIRAEFLGSEFNYEFLMNENFNAPSYNSTVSLFKDNSDCIWTSNFDGGVYYLNLRQQNFKRIHHNFKDVNSVSENYIRAITEDEDRNIWIGTEKKGLNYYNFKTGINTVFRHDKSDNNSISSNRIRSLKLDREDRLWIGTISGINILEKENPNSFFKINSELEHGKRLTNNVIFSIDVDKFGNIWAGSWQKGLNRIVYNNRDDFSVENIYKDQNNEFSLSSNVITYIHADKYHPEVFVGTDNGLNHIFLNEDGTIKTILHYIGVEEYKRSLSSNFVWPIERQNDSVLWIGTLGGGLNKITLDPKSEYGYQSSVFSLNKNSELLDIESILFDKEEQKLWLGGIGITEFDIREKSFKSYDRGDGLSGNSFKVGAAHKGKSGRFYFGGPDGLTFFKPKEIEPNKFKAKIVLTDLVINNKIISVGEKVDSEIKLSRTLNELTEISINKSENNFKIQFSSLHFANPYKTKFKYKLKGYDKDWIHTDAANRSASYSNLSYGNYEFMVMGTNNDGIWSEQIKKIKVKVIPPWWYTIYAKIFYAILFVLMLALSYYLVIRWLKLKQEFEISKIQEQKKEEMYQFTSQFFVNISHEFKTPLTLILNPLESLLKNQQFNEQKVKKMHQLMYGNAKRLLRLINELVDYRKVNSKMYRINVDEYNLAQTVNDILESFKTSLDHKEIKVSYKVKLSKEAYIFDLTILEKILFNIIGNSIKYTGRYGVINILIDDNYSNQPDKLTNSFSIESDDEYSSYFSVVIEDNGIGIAPKAIKRIFDRFFQGANNIRDIGGSGIGLTFVKSLILVHKGKLFVNSKEGLGTRFIVQIPNIDTKDHYGSNSKDSLITLSNNALSPFLDKIEIDVSVPVFDDYTKATILIVEDNEQLRGFLKTDLESNYSILEARDGVEALEILRKNSVDIIISDIMMPRMDGIQFCRKVKTDSDYNHIPVILLTAKSNVDSHLQGVKSGADIYMPKPFSMEVLVFQIENLLDSKKRLKEKMIENTFSEARKYATANSEDEFLKQVVDIIDANIEDVNFDIEKLCKLLGISKTKLYTKIKGLTNESIGSMIRRIRLKKAAQILSSSDLNIVQVMDKVGIQSQSHFTKSFKKEFGKTPSEFVKDLKKGME